MQRPFWEANATSGANCYTLGAACSQGSVPPAGVAAASAADVAAALSFAAAHNLTVAVKSSGHEIQGRSTAPNALLVWLHGLQGVQVEPAFAACPGDAPGPAVTAGPGVSYGDLYALLDPGQFVVGGSARTVSAAGGHALAGGHSFASPMYGLAADNVLQLAVVLADGSQVVASACSNEDLFWALRGGGGGTFGVVTAATHRVHATPPVLAGVLFEVALLRGSDSVSAWLAGFLALTPALTDAAANPGGGVFGGYFNVEPVADSPGVSVWVALWVCNCSVAQARGGLAALAALAASDPANFLTVNLTISPYASYEAWHSSFDPPASGDRTGASSTIGCRFVPASAAASAPAAAAAAGALAAVAGYVPLLGHLVVGGAVAAADPGGARTSVTPAWRSALWHMCIGVGWGLGANSSEVSAAFAAVSELTGVWRSAFPDSGAYWGESDFLEPDWQGSFWGAHNYARLQGIKARVDPRGVFGCHHCVELP